MAKTQCKDCPKNSRREAKYPGPRCYTHNKQMKDRRKKNAQNMRLNRTYNITQVQYQELYDIQGGVCAICGPMTKRSGKTKRLSVDHDHSCCPGPKSCGECVRGLLCSQCNKIVGHFRDNPGCFQRGYDYLIDPPKNKMKGKDE